MQLLLKKVTILSPTSKYHLKKKDILNTSKRKPKYSFWVSDYTESFEKSTAIFFNQKLKLVEKRIWKDERY
jgi:glutamate racemase